MGTTLENIAQIIHGELIGGSPTALVHDIAEIQYATSDEVSFVGNSKYLKYLDSTNAGAVILPKEYTGDFTPRIVVENPQLAVRTLIDHFRPPRPPAVTGIHPTAFIHEKARLADNVAVGPYAVISEGTTVKANSVIGAHVYVGRDCEIGSNCYLHPNISLYDETILGDRVILHSGTVIGSDGYGYVYSDGVHHKIRQVGRVRIESDVEIGANCTIDRAALGETVIGEGSKLDNLIQIGHNVKTGKGCLIVSQAGISGSTRLGNYVTIGGQAGLAGHIQIGDGAIIASQAGVSKDVEAGLTVSGYPAKPHNIARRQEVYLRRIPDLMDRLIALEENLKSRDPE